MTAAASVVSVTIPIKVESLNEKLRQNPRDRARHTQAHRGLARVMCRVPAAGFADAIAAGKAVTITLTRVAPGTLDTDNLAGSLKACRDGVADAFGFSDDSDPRLFWRYDQRKGTKRPRGLPAEYAVEIDMVIRVVP